MGSLSGLVAIPTDNLIMRWKLGGNVMIKMRQMYRLVAALPVIALASCAGRAPAPVAVVQAQDRYMTCAAIMSEVQANNVKVTELGKEDGQKVAQNVAVGAVGLFIPILWFGMDFQNASGKEAAALQSRQGYLATMAEQKKCAVDSSSSTDK